MPQTRTPDAHFFTEVRYKGAKTVAVTPDYSEVAKLSDLWLHPKQGTDAALAMAMGHVALKEFYFPDGGKQRSSYFDDYARRYTDLPLLVMLTEHTLPDGTVTMVPGRYLRASDFNGQLGQKSNPEWKTVAFDTDGKAVLPNGSIGFRWGEPGREDEGKWNLEAKEARGNSDVKLKLSVIEDGEQETQVVDVGFPYFGGNATRPTSPPTPRTARSTTPKYPRCACAWARPVKNVTPWSPPCSICRSRSTASTVGWAVARRTFNDDAAYTPAWQEIITGVPRDQVITVARQFADNADKTHGKSMIIIGAAMNHWYHADMNYRGVINLLMMCGCIGQSGGGWAHYVGQEKLRPQTGWVPLAFATDWVRPPRQMNSTSFFYAHTDQWRYEKLGMDEIVSPTLSVADKAAFSGSMIDFNVRAERMGWLPSAPQLKTNPMQVVRDAQAAGMDAKDYVVQALKDGTLEMSCEDPDAPQNWPRNMFVWRSNLLGSSGKGHEYFCKHLLGTENGVQGKDLGQGRRQAGRSDSGTRTRRRASWTCWSRSTSA